MPDSFPDPLGEPASVSAIGISAVPTPQRWGTIVAAWVCDVGGRILAAHGPLASAGVSNIFQALAGITGREDGLPAWTPAHLIDQTQALWLRVMGPSGRSLDLSCAPLRDAAGTCWGWLLQLQDLAALHVAHAQRDEALRAMNHDMRSPQSATLALLELRQMNPQAITIDELLERVDRHARRALSIMDGFYEAARVEREPAQRDEIDLVDLVFDAVDAVWADGRVMGLDVSLAERPDAAPCRVDRRLVLLALDRLLRNALRFSAAGAQVRCVLVRDAANGANWAIGVIDDGPGLEPSRQAGMGFGPRSAPGDDDRIRIAMRQGHLGLAMVHAVALKHGGALTLQSREGAGCRFDLSLPARDAPPG